MPKDPSESLKAELTRRLLGATAEIPTSTLGRLGRTAGMVFRGGRLMRKNAEDVDLEAVARVVSSIGELKGIAMKAGQLLSYVDISLPDELREALSVLQTHAQPMPGDQVRDIVRAELGEAASELLSDLEPEPIAAASIGQVHRARLADGKAVAVKVQYPDVARAIEADFGPAAVGTKMVRLIYPNAKVDAFLAEARARFLEECDYLHEAHCQARFAQIFASHPVLRVPAVIQRLCARRVLTTELMAGDGFETFLNREHSQEQRDVIGTAMFEFYVATLFRHGLYNCDPHPGNYLFRKDGQVVMLDYGCTREFEPEFVARLARLTKAVHADERRLLHESFVELGMVREGKKYDFPPHAIWCALSTAPCCVTRNSASTSVKP